jgi:hypothetical protein
VARQAGLLCQVIEQWHQRAGQPREPWEPAKAGVEMLVGWLVLRGVRPPG